MKSVKTRMMALILALIAGPAILSASGSPKPNLPAGTRINVQLITYLSSSADRPGDTFVAEVEEPIFANGMEVVHAGTKLHGRVTFVKRPGRLKGRAEMRLEADSITLKNGKEYSFTAQLTNSNVSGAKVKDSEGTVEGKSKTLKQAAKDSGIGAAIGAGGGAVTVGGTGALYGAGIGAVAGLLRVLVARHKDVVLQPGTPLVFVLTSPGKLAKATHTKGTPAPFVCETCQ